MIQAASSQPHELCDLWVALTGDRFEFGRHRGNTFDECSHFGVDLKGKSHMENRI
jgi:hypothetical protein